MITGDLLITGPTAEPVDLALAYKHLRLAGDQDAGEVMSYVRAARAWVEQHTSRGLLEQTWELTLGRWPAGRDIVLPRGPLRSVTSITYLDAAGATQTLSNTLYWPRLAAWQPMVTRAPAATWPALLDGHPEAVRVRYVVGYDADKVPPPLLQAILLLLGHYHENREQSISGTIIGDIPMGVEALCAPYRIVGAA